MYHSSAMILITRYVSVYCRFTHINCLTSTTVSPLQELNHLSIEDRTKGKETIIMQMDDDDG